MAISEPYLTIAGAATEAVFGYLFDKDGLTKNIRTMIGRDPVKLSYKNALGYAILDFRNAHPEWYANLFDASFFEHEAAPVLSQFLLPQGQPDSVILAQLWAKSLGIQHSQERHALIWECEPAAAFFLARFSLRLKNEEALRDMNQERRFEQITEMMQELVEHFDARKATPHTQRAYLEWLIDRNRYLDPRGTFQVQRQVQLKLDEIYISLLAQSEAAPSQVDRRLMEKELANLEKQFAISDLPMEEIEDRREQILSGFENRRDIQSQPRTPIKLHDAVTHHRRLVILGDPGSGKTTLLRYLALQYAEALYSGLPVGSSHPNPELGSIFFPILIRIADYADNDIWKQKSLSTFLTDACIVSECPQEGLKNLIQSELGAGNCLILLDGLDEIVESDDRRSVVQRIEDFVRRYDKGGVRGKNRFIVTSRIAGYRSAPLGEPFAHYVVQDMNEDQILLFLERWCQAVEDAQTPDISLSARQENAQREIDGIMKAVKSNTGVRRLAANPLMLRTLALIHRIGAQLPQRRIELYKLAADTLSHTWRIAQGVPSSALVEERYLTRLLSKMAYWLHMHKPTGIATEREVYTVLGQEWARLNQLEWQDDDPNPLIDAEIDKFLIAVREHTGLFVERAPRRYGFMHLTFEEYYTARYLVARRRDAAIMIRKHLHNVRWDEPILLALGFVGMDYPDEATELFQTAILAEGSEAEELGFKPSAYEDLLGRDYLFALRCISEQIPIHRRIVQKLLKRFISELSELLSGSDLDSAPLGFRQYQELLWQRLAYLEGNQELEFLVVLHLLDLLRYRPKFLTSVVPPNFESDFQDCIPILKLINRLSKLSKVTISRVIKIIENNDNNDLKFIFNRLQRSNKRYGTNSKYLIAMDLLTAIMGEFEQTKYLTESTSSIIDKFLEDNNPFDEFTESSEGVWSWEYGFIENFRSGIPSLEALEFGFININRGILDIDIKEFDAKSPYWLRDSEPIEFEVIKHELDPQIPILQNIIDRFINASKEYNIIIAHDAVLDSLQRKTASPEILQAIILTLNHHDAELRTIAVGFLQYIDNNSVLVKEALFSVYEKYCELSILTSIGLGKRGYMDRDTQEDLEWAVIDGFLCWEAANLLGNLGDPNESTIETLILGLIHNDKNTRNACMGALINLSRRFPKIISRLILRLEETIRGDYQDDFDTLEYAYETFSRLLTDKKF